MNEKIKEQLFKKNLIYHYDISNNTYSIPVPVRKWNNTQLAFECPFCFNKWKLNNTPYKTGHSIMHFHGDGGKDNDGNYGTRTPHCSVQARQYWKLPTFEFKLIGGNLIY